MHDKPTSSPESPSGLPRPEPQDGPTTLPSGQVRAQEQQNIIDSVPVFGKRYEAAVDELEEIEELLAP